MRPRFGVMVMPLSNILRIDLLLISLYGQVLLVFAINQLHQAYPYDHLYLSILGICHLSFQLPYLLKF
jgi:hypothetical protein